MSVSATQDAQDAVVVLYPWLQSKLTYLSSAGKQGLIVIQGNDNTFAGFPEHLRALVSNALPKVSVVAVTYPTFETRGDLSECVGRFREWYAACHTVPSDISVKGCYHGWLTAISI